ncbi:hypothetical protein J3B02_001262 [Coemansia erecta]|uniref:Zinc finger C2H2 LYAR-type domain-containing protein n=1 Tax=Coemansia asiatica TaxID=1052880 RepID=A0A9W8CKN9_9FUNG|nr:hypothetical protein LPJ64_002787 [Coemansia asiatica]KAJ2857049.1 hypothetical protein J3B02_001262 [Coemansia erecta]
MVSFVCNYCQETLKKAKLDMHTQRCRNASFSCIDCSKDFAGTSYRQHTSCITEAEKYEGKLYKGNNKKSNSNKANKQIIAKSTVDQLKAKVEELKTENKEKKRSREDDSEKSGDGKKAKNGGDAWDKTKLPSDTVDALVCAIAAHVGETVDETFDDMKKQCVRMVTCHPENKASKSDVKDKFKKALVLALQQGKVKLVKGI